MEDTNTLLIRQSASSFQFYATGRRFCRSLTAHLDLRKRQDLLSYLVRLVSPGDDVLDIEVEMNEAAMPPIVLAIAAPRTIRGLAKDESNKGMYGAQKASNPSLLSLLCIGIDVQNPGCLHGAAAIADFACASPAMNLPSY